MAYVDKIFAAMPFDTEVSPEEVAAVARIRVEDASVALKELEKGGLVQCVFESRWIKQRKYKSLQRKMF